MKLTKIKIKKILSFLLLGIVIIYIVYYVYTLYAQNHRKRETPHSISQVDKTYIHDNIQPIPTITNINTGTINVAPTFYIEDLPTSLPGYAYTKFDINQQYINDIFTTFNLTKLLENTDYPYRSIIGTHNDYSITIDIDGNSILYQKDNGPYFIYKNFSENTPNDIINAVDILKIPKRLGIPISKYQQAGFQLYDFNSTEPIQVQNIEQANVIKYSFVAKLNGYPVIDKPTDISSNSIDIYVDAKHETIKVFANFIGTVSKTSNYKLKNITEITNDIQAGKANLISGTFPIGEDLKYTSIEHGYIAYYANDTKLVPVLVLVGNSYTVYNNHGKGYAVLDVIK